MGINCWGKDFQLSAFKIRCYTLRQCRKNTYLYGSRLKNAKLSDFLKIINVEKREMLEHQMFNN